MAKSNSSITAPASSVPHLPMDLITDNILSRLPVKSLIRFKSVSKPWFSLIESPHFINLHLNFSKLNPNFSSILSSVNIPGTVKYLFRLNLIDAIDKPIDMDFSFMSGNVCRVLGISNGLVCVLFGSEFSPGTVIICNPVTGNFRTIPPFVAYGLQHTSFFGFYSNEKGFELIRVNYSYGTVEVISFSSRANIWKDVRVKLGKHIISTKPMDVEPFHENQNPLFKNGVFYWEGYSEGSIVVVLDLFNEEFDVIPAPGDDDVDIVELVGLVGFKEQIMIVICACRQLDLWILNENDKTWKMLKLIDVSDSIPGFYIVRVLGCTGNGQLVLRHDDDNHSEVYLCDIYTDDTNILTYVNVRSMDEMYLFAESLESLKTSEIGDEV